MSSETTVNTSSKATVAIMQPYFLPYLGYYQLVAAVDRFVFLDDVNFIKRGWINRNQMLGRDGATMFTIPLQGASQNKKINEIPVAIDDRWLRKFLGSMEHVYSGAPFYSTTLALIQELISSQPGNIAELAKASVRSVCDYANVNTHFVDSSSIYQNADLAGQERIRDICLREGAIRYVNAAGGRDLYNAAFFSEVGIELRFLDRKVHAYPQSAGEFVPDLSILDALMFLSQNELAEYLTHYQLGQ